MFLYREPAFERTPLPPSLVNLKYALLMADLQRPSTIGRLRGLTGEKTTMHPVTACRVWLFDTADGAKFQELKKRSKRKRHGRGRVEKQIRRYDLRGAKYIQRRMEVQ